MTLISSVNLCLQHVRRDTGRRAGLSAAADPCFRLSAVDAVVVLDTLLAVILLSQRDNCC